MPENNQILSVEGQLVGLPLAGPESFSAQQLDYLKRALGVDETVLWKGTAASSVTCSESVSNFERIRVWMNVNSDGTRKACIELIPGYESEYIFYSGVASNLMHFYSGILTASSTTVAVDQGRHLWISTGNSSTVGSEAQSRNIYKVIGIGRKESA